MYRYQEVEIEGAPVPPAPELPPEPTIAEILATDSDADFALPEAVPVSRGDLAKSCQCSKRLEGRYDRPNSPTDCVADGRLTTSP